MAVSAGASVGMAVDWVDASAVGPDDAIGLGSTTPGAVGATVGVPAAQAARKMVSRTRLRLTRVQDREMRGFFIVNVSFTMGFLTVRHLKSLLRNRCIREMHPTLTVIPSYAILGFVF
jgi:hypothetical protein